MGGGGGVKRLGLTALATAWVTAVAAAWIWLAILAGNGGGENALVACLFFGAVPAAGLAAVPIIIYDSIGDRP